MPTVEPTFPDLTTSWSLELMFSDDLAALDLFWGAIVAGCVVE
jgi:hypothetical protein